MIEDALLSETSDKVLFLILGWLFGLLGPAIVDAIRGRRERAELRMAILAELHQLQYKISGTVYLTSVQTGHYNREFLLWQKRIVESYKGPLSTGATPKVIQAALSLTDEQLAEAARRLINPPGVAMGLKTFEAPLLRAKIDELGAYSISFQNLLLEIASRIRIVNEEIEQYRFYFQQTFAAAGNNHDRLSGNIAGSYEAVRVQAIKICDFIDKAEIQGRKE